MQTFRIIIIFLLLAGLSFNRQHIQQLQNSEQLNSITSNTEDLPPSIVLMSTALGPLKGLLANAVMWRAGEMQDEKQYTEAVQLTNMMTSIQPHYPSVWRYQAFNLSFNIAADFVKPEEKWPWILSGIELLRDRGLKYNPGDKGIRHELLRIIMDKINGTDKYNNFMQDEWTRIMLPYFVQGNRSDLTKMNEAVQERSQLLEDATIRKIHETASARGIDLFDFQNNPPELSLTYIKNLLGGLPSEQQFPAIKKAIIKIFWHEKRQRITTELNFDLKHALWIDENYGPLDWRSHQAWALYYGASDNYEDFRSAGLNYAPYINTALKSAFFNGRIIYDEESQGFIRSYNVEMLPKMFEYYDFLYGADPKNPRVRSSYKNFLESAITLCYNASQTAAAEDLYYHYIQDGFGQESLSFQGFIMQSMKNTLKNTSAKLKRGIIESVIEQAFTIAKFKDTDRSKGLLNRARLIWTMHQKEFQSTAEALPEWNLIFKAVSLRWQKNNKVQQDNFDGFLEEIEKSGERKKQISPHSNGELH